MTGTSESAENPSLSDNANGNAEKKQDEIEKKKTEFKQKFN